MAGQDVGFFDVGTECPDIVIENGDLKAENGLQTAALISLFSDKRITMEELKGSETDQRGWWADTIATPAEDKIGSALWNALERGKTDDDTLNAAQDAAEDAFEWMIEDGLAKSVSVTTVVLGQGEILISGQILKPDGSDIPFKAIWDAQSLKIVEVA